MKREAMKKTLLSLSLALSAFAHAADLDNKPDVTQFDVAGVRLGMSVEEAQAALAAKYPNGEMGKLETGGSPFDYKTKIAKSLRLKDGKQSVNVYFSTDTLNGKRDSIVVSRIMYSLPRTDENLAALQAAAKEKYGEPTLGGSDSNYWRWCQEPEKVFAYECSSHKKPTLTLASMMDTHLDLQNPEYKQAERDALEAEKNTKPSI